MNNNSNFQIFNVLLFGAAALVSGLTHAQGCTHESSRTAPDSRYVDNGDGTVRDLQVGLVWQKCSVGQSGNDCSEGAARAFKWDEAIQQDQLVNDSGGFAGHTDWRVPKIKELRSLVEVGCWSPSINLTLFPNTPDVEYWTSSSYTGFTNNAWYISFNSGKSQYNHSKLKYSVRLVRTAE